MFKKSYNLNFKSVEIAQIFDNKIKYYPKIHLKISLIFLKIKKEF